MKRALLLFVCGVLLCLGVTAPAIAAPFDATPPADKANWQPSIWRGSPPERATRPYSSYTYYSELLPILKKIDAASARMTMKTMGLSANGNPLYIVTITWPMSKQSWAANDRYRQLLLTNPTKAKAMISTTPGLRPALWFNGSIHGFETMGVDACLRLVREFSRSNDPAIVRVLKRAILVIDVCQNPDGRITDTQVNANGVNLNRDFLTLTESETRATVKYTRKWLPIVFNDMHGYHRSVLIEPTTIPINPAYDWDLLIKHMLPMAKLQRQLMETKTGYAAQIPFLWGSALSDPLTDEQTDPQRWDGYAPIYTPQMSEFFGAPGQTVETNFKSNAGVTCCYWTARGNMDYALAHRRQMMLDQAEGFIRQDKNVDGAGGAPSTSNRPWDFQARPQQLGGIAGQPLWVLPDDPANPGTKLPFPYDSVVGALSDDAGYGKPFPFAFVVPMGDEQQDIHAAVKFVNHARRYGIEVRKATIEMTSGDVTVSKGDYIVPMAQPMRDLAYTMLWNGENVSLVYGVNQMYDISAWNLARYWGFDSLRVEDSFSVNQSTAPLVTSTQKIAGAINGDVDADQYFVFSGDNLDAIRCVNEMLDGSLSVGMLVAAPGADYPDVAAGDFVVNTRGLRWMEDTVASLSARYGITFNKSDADLWSDAYILPSSYSRPKIAANAGDDTYYALQLLGFGQMNPRLMTLDKTATPDASHAVFINSSGSSATKAVVDAWLSPASKKTYIGIGAGAGAAGTSSGAFASLMPNVEAKAGGSADNGIVNVNFIIEGPATAAGDALASVAAGYPAADYAFVYPPGWFTHVGVGAFADDGIAVNATYGQGDWGPYDSGFWALADATSGNPAAAPTAGDAAVLSYVGGDGDKIFFSGIPFAFRTQTDNGMLMMSRLILLSTAAAPEI